MKGQIKKSNDPKIVKKLGYKLRKAYPLKEIDRLLNMLVEESQDHYKKKSENKDYILEISILDDETFVSRWESEEVKLNHQESKHVKTDVFDSEAKVENSLLLAIVTRDISQDPDVTQDSIEDFKKDYEMSYQFEPERKTKKKILKKKEVNKNEEEKEDIEEVGQKEPLDSVPLEESNQTSSGNSDKLDRIYDLLKKREVSATGSSTEEVSIEPKVSKKTVQELLPVVIPKYKAMEVKREYSKDTLMQKKYDFIYDRRIEKEQLKETYYFNLEQQLLLKYIELKEETEDKIKAYQSSLMLSDEDLNTSEEKKRAEMAERRKAFIEEEKSKNLEVLKRYKEELELKYQEKVNKLNEELDNKLKELDQSFEQEVQDHLSNMMDNHELIMSSDIEQEQKRLDSEIRKSLKNLIHEQQQQLKNELYDYDKETFQLLKSKIESFKQALRQEEQAYREKLHTETEKLKYEHQLKQAQHHIEETRREEAKARQKADQLKIEESQRVQLELQTKQKAQEIELQKLEEKKKRNRLKEEEILVQKELLKSEQIQKAPQYMTTKQASSKSIWVSLILGGLLLSIIISIVIFTANMTSKMMAEEENEQPTFNELLKDRNYEQALNEYPSKYKVISDTAYKNKDIEGLDVVVKNVDDPKTYMYQALLNQDKKSVVKIYEKYKEQLNMKDQELEIVGQYMIDENNIEGAKALNKDLESKVLSQKIKEKEDFNKFQKLQKESYEENSMTENGSK